MDYKTQLGYLATTIAIGSYLPYLFTIYKGQTKPHAFTWFVWGSVNIVGFAAVITSGGGSGSWVLAVNVLLCYLIAGIGFYQGAVKYDLFDWLALSGGLLGIFFWWLTNNPLYAVILVTLSDGIGFIPSYRKGWRLPFEENITAFAIGILYYVLAIFALESLTVTTSLYHFIISLLDGAFVVMILLRRRQMVQKI